MPCPKKGLETLHQDMIQKEFSCFSAQAFSDGFHPTPFTDGHRAKGNRVPSPPSLKSTLTFPSGAKLCRYPR